MDSAKISDYECCVCWNKSGINAGSVATFSYLKSDFNKVKIHLGTFVELNSGTDRVNPDGGHTNGSYFKNNYVSLCLNCLEECKKLLLIYTTVEEHKKQLNETAELFASKIMMHREQNRPANSFVNEGEIKKTNEPVQNQNQTHLNGYFHSEGFQQVPVVTCEDENLPPNGFSTFMDQPATNFNLLNNGIGTNPTGTETSTGSNSSRILGSHPNNVIGTWPKTEDLQTRSQNLIPHFVTMDPYTYTCENPQYFKCKNCENVFSSHELLIDHICTHTLQCLVCDIIYGSQQQFLVHKTRYPKYYLCDECPSAFHFEKGLTRHKERAHELYPPLSGATGGAEPNLQNYNTVETNVNSHKQKYFCILCAISFAKMQTYKIHCHAIHGEINEYSSKNQCRICGKLVAHLEQHMIRHTYPLYACTFCNRKYRIEKDLLRHQQLYCKKKL